MTAPAEAATEERWAFDPNVPARYLRALYSVHDDLMPKDWVAELGRWLYYNRALLTRGGDDAGEARFNYEVVDVDKHCDLIGAFRSAVLARLAEGCDACGGIPLFDLLYFECHATLYHHGCHFDWHNDAPGIDFEFVPSRRITFAYYLHSDPKMFKGGELEFLDGTRVEPKNNRLLFFHPLQQHRIVPVECWSAEPIHGRWALMGWVHGEAPEGYAAPTLYGREFNDYTKFHQLLS